MLNMTDIKTKMPEQDPQVRVTNFEETATGYTEMTSRAVISEGDYVDNLGYVGKTVEGKPIIIIFKNALCTSGRELEGKNKEAAVPPFTFECFADLSSEADTLPWSIFYPTPAA